MSFCIFMNPFIIKTSFVIRASAIAITGGKSAHNVPIALVKSRDNKMTNLLLNRDTMSKMGYVVHPNNAHILTKEMEKVKIV